MDCRMASPVDRVVEPPTRHDNDHQQKEEIIDDDDDDDHDDDACWQEWLGGVDWRDIQLEAWHHADYGAPPVIPRSHRSAGLSIPVTTSLQEDEPGSESADYRLASLGAWAHFTDPHEDRLLYNSSSSSWPLRRARDPQRPERGWGLFAKKSFSRGQVLFTERAALAVPLTPARPTMPQTGDAADAEEEHGPHRDDDDDDDDLLLPQKEYLRPPPTCQQCFRSLVTASQFMQAVQDRRRGRPPGSSEMITDDSTLSRIPALPQAQQLWPVLEWEEEEETTSSLHQNQPAEAINLPPNPTEKPVDPENHDQSPPPTGQDRHSRARCRRDRHGRTQCTDCQTLFCSQACRAQFFETLGPPVNQVCGAFGSTTDTDPLNPSSSPQPPACCQWQQVWQELTTMPTERTVDTDRTTAPPSPGLDTSLQPAVLLAVRMFVYTIHYYRQHQGHLSEIFWQGLVGQAEDVMALELGRPTFDPDDHWKRYDLRPVYEPLVRIYQLDAEEQQGALSLELFHRLASIAARNGIEFATKSPFQQYYAALLRSTGGRGSIRHEQLKKQVAEALGATSGQLERGMDDWIDRQVTPTLVGIFPLTARINHSCDPTAQLQSRAFADYHLDVVALQDLAPGQEITISYLDRKTFRSRHQRRRELQAKYLFTCDCRLCRFERHAT